MNLSKYAAVLGVLALGFASAANAATTNTATTTFTVNATVLSTCAVAASPLNFGNYSGGALLNGTTTITVTCTTSTPYNVGLDAGKATGATVTTRKMKDTASGNLLNYSLFSDTNRTVNWGNTSGTDTVAGTGTGSGQPITVYGQIPAGQYPTPSTTYQDTITATVYY
jgi:spore coat protein U-like protein